MARRADSPPLGFFAHVLHGILAPWTDSDLLDRPRCVGSLYLIAL